MTSFRLPRLPGATLSLVLLGALALSACRDDAATAGSTTGTPALTPSDGQAPTPAGPYRVGATVTGLDGTGLVPAEQRR